MLLLLLLLLLSLSLMRFRRESDCARLVFRARSGASFCASPLFLLPPSPLIPRSLKYVHHFFLSNMLHVCLLLSLLLTDRACVRFGAPSNLPPLSLVLVLCPRVFFPPFHVSN